MDVSARRAFRLLKDLAFERLSASEDERRAAERLLAEAQSTGAEAHIEEFQVPCGKVRSARLLVTAPYQKEYPVTGYERSLSTKGLDAPFYYAEDMQPVHLQNATVPHHNPCYFRADRFDPLVPAVHGIDSDTGQHHTMFLIDFLRNATLHHINFIRRHGIRHLNMH